MIEMQSGCTIQSDLVEQLIGLTQMKNEDNKMKFNYILEALGVSWDYSQWLWCRTASIDPEEKNTEEEKKKEFEEMQCLAIGKQEKIIEVLWKGYCEAMFSFGMPQHT